MPYFIKNNGSHCPTWKGLLATVLVCLVIVGSAMGWAGYVDRKFVEMRIEEQRKTIVNLLVRLEDRVDSLAVEILKHAADGAEP